MLRPWLQGVLTAIASEAHANCPVGTNDAIGTTRSPAVSLDKRGLDAGKHMKDTINTVIKVDGTKMTGWVTVNSPYAVFVHNGTNAHPIFPRGDYPLRFFWPKAPAISSKSGPAENVVRFMHVNHPGNASNPFLLRAGQSVTGGG